MTLVPVGPLTNIASALVKAPELAPKIREIVLMGGAMREGGNTTPSAEFNIYVDPHAARVVFECGRPLTVMGLDVTHQVLATPPRVGRIRALGTRAAETVASMLQYFNRFDTARRSRNQNIHHRVHGGVQRLREIRCQSSFLEVTALSELRISLLIPCLRSGTWKLMSSPSPQPPSRR